MKNCAGNIIETISEQEEEKDVWEQQMNKLSHLVEQLEPMYLHQHTQETLSHFIVQLQIISKKFRHLPLEETPLLRGLKKDLLKDLQEANIELLLALDQYDTQGRTRRFYQCLSTCQSYLEQALECKLETCKPVPGLTIEHQPGVKQEDPMTRISALYKAIIHTQLNLAKTSKLLVNEEEIWYGNYCHLEQTLMIMRQLVKELHNILYEDSSIYEEATFYLFRLKVMVGYVDEKIQHLLELFHFYHLSTHISSKQAYKLKREITSNLELIQHRSGDLPQAIIALLDHIYPSVRGHRRLYLVKTEDG